MNGKTKRLRNKVKESAKSAAQVQHLEIIRSYINGVIELRWNKRLKVCWYIFTKRNPFGGKK